ncbi:MAG: hypothetical protein IPP99_00275 [Chitinophagaceae bacterium]|nr:hypothetical protein [Chitinophagaceae bacterium]
MNIRLKCGVEIIIEPILHGRYDPNNLVSLESAFFVTKNGSFGGFSYAYAHRFYPENTHLHDGAMYLSELGDIDRKNYKFISWVNRDLEPNLIATEIVNTVSDSSELMKQILLLSEKYQWKSIRLCQLVHLNSNQKNIFDGIGQALHKYYSTNLTPFVRSVRFVIDGKYAMQLEMVLKLSLQMGNLT